jgi:excisionase family DNA binding protein
VSAEIEPTEDVYLSVAQVAHRLSISKAMVFRLMQRGDLPAIRLGDMRRIREADLRAFIERLPAG